MNISEFIKKIRRDNNLTQKELANKLHVTYQAVSKWERKESIPDISILKEISKLYNVSIDEIVNGEKKDKKNNKLYLIIGFMIIFIIIVILLIFLLNKDKDSIELKIITTSCDSFNITGSVAYVKDTTSMKINSVEFCGEKDETIYEKIECNLYETYNNTNKLISSCGSTNNTNLEEFLKTIKINVDNYKTMCNTFTSSSVYLEINAYLKSDAIMRYKIPIDLEDNC